MNAAVFVVVNSVLLKPLPFPEADRILLMSNQYRDFGTPGNSYSSAFDYFDRLRELDVFDEQAAFRLLTWTIQLDGHPQRPLGMAVTPSLFRVIQVPPMLGRTFSEEEGAELGRSTFVILSYGMWQQFFGGDPDIVGKAMYLGGNSGADTIIGVMPQDFIFVEPDVQFWYPLGIADSMNPGGRHNNRVYNVGRLHSEATLEQAQAAVDALNAANQVRFPELESFESSIGFYTRVEPLQEMLVRPVKSLLYLLWGGAAFVLLIAGMNVGNLALVRSRVHAREMATRVALGASRRKLTRQSITESVILTLTGGVAGLVLGWWSVTALANLGLEGIPRLTEIQIDLTVVAFTLGVSAAVGVLIGLVGASQLVGIDLGSLLSEEGRTGTAGRSSRAIRRGFIVVQVGFAVVLLIGAGLLLESFRKLVAVDPGFRADQVITAATNLPGGRYSTGEERRAFMTPVLEAIHQIPGVEAAGVATNIPFLPRTSDSTTLNGRPEGPLMAEGYDVQQPGESLIIPLRTVASPGYFEALGIPLIRGRYFDRRDSEGAPAVAILDERLARRFWPDSDPVGQRVYWPRNLENPALTDDRTPFFEVVGVVGSVQMEDLAGGGNQVGAYYLAYDQFPFGFSRFVVRVSGDPAPVIEGTRNALWDIDPLLAFFEVRSMADLIDRSMSSRRIAMILSLTFAAVALLLAAVGVYGVLAYLVSRRTREIGIRIAMGSSTGGVFRLVLREGVLVVTAGVALGLAGFAVLGRVLENQLYGIAWIDPFVIASVVILLTAVAVLACVVPARRAIRVDPMVALRHE